MSNGERDTSQFEPLPLEVRNKAASNYEKFQANYLENGNVPFLGGNGRFDAKDTQEVPVVRKSKRKRYPRKAD